MYADILPALRCPQCTHALLTLLGPLEEGGEIVAGALHCPACRTQTAILDGVWDALNDQPVAHTPAQLTNYFPPTARVYEPAWRWLALTLLSGRRFPLREELLLLRELMQPQPGQLYLDDACSAGLYARALAQSGAVVVGIDHSFPFVREARRRARQRGLRISFMRATAQALPLANGALAGVGMGGSLNELGDQAGALAEVRRVMQPHGRFFCMNLVAAASGWGRLLQRMLGTGGIEFPGITELNQQFAAAQLRPRAQWVWGVVAITLLTTENQAEHVAAHS